MNIERINQNSFGINRKNNENKPLERENSTKNDSKTAIKDGFIKNNSTAEFTDDIEQLLKFAKSMPDIREEKLAEVNKRISEGYYSQAGFINELSNKFAVLL